MIKSRGFTLLELMVTIVVAAVLLTLGIPSFVQFVQNARRDSQMMDVVNSLNVARSEAVKRGQRVTVCPSADGASCAGTTNWDAGWIVFADANGDGTVNNGVDAVLLVHGAMPTGTTLRSVANTRVTFQNTGYSLAFGDTLNLCDSRGAASGKQAVISTQGTVTTSTGATVCP